MFLKLVFLFLYVSPNGLPYIREPRKSSQLEELGQGTDRQRGRENPTGD